MLIYHKYHPVMAFRKIWLITQVSLFKDVGNDRNETKPLLFDNTHLI